MPAKAASITRRDVMSAASIYSLFAAGVVAAAVADPMSAWRDLYGRWADNKAVWPLMEEANALGLTPGQVFSLMPTERAGGPCLSLEAPNGDFVHIYPHGTLRVHARGGEAAR